MSERRGRPAISRGAELKRLACAAMMAAAAFGLAPAGLAEGPDRPCCDTQAQADAKSVGCLSCHTATDSKSMHTGEVILSCVDCHGGKGMVRAQGGPGSPPYEKAKHEAHVRAKNRELWKGSANAAAYLQRERLLQAADHEVASQSVTAVFSPRDARQPS